MDRPTPSRRNLLHGAAAAGIALPVLAACGSEPSSAPTADATAGSPAPTTSATPTAGGTADGLLRVPAKDVPEGGGTIIPNAKVVVTQPTAGEFKAFSAVCTHKQCLVAGVADEQIICTCHGSRFDITDGHVLEGPASKGLPEMTVTLEGDELTIA